MVSALVGSVLATLALLAACGGWGALVARAAGAGPRDWGLLAALGLAALALLGGPLDRLGAISPAVARAIVTVGVVAAGVEAWRRRGEARAAAADLAAALRADRAAALGAAALALVLALQVASAGLVPLAENDDVHAYAVFPARMLEAGALGEDPLCTRRLVSGLGGQSFLHALLLSMVPARHLNGLEHGVAVLVLLGLVLGHARALGPRRALLPVALALLTRLPTLNASSAVTGIALLVALLRALGLCGDALAPRARTLLLALLVGGLMSLKNHLVPAAGLFVLAWHLVERRGIARVAEPALVGALALVMVSPWMVGLWRSSGTPLYPLFGRGIDGSIAGTYLAPNARLTPGGALDHALKLVSSPACIANLILLAIGWRAARAPSPGEPGEGVRSPTAPSPAGVGTPVEDVPAAVAAKSSGSPWAPVAVTIAAWVCALGMTLAVDGFPRYQVGFGLSVTLVLVVAALRPGPDDDHPAWWRRPAVVALAASCVLLGAMWEDRRGDLMARARALRPGALAQWSAQDEARVAALQAAVPAGERMVAHLSRPFLLDFARNPILVADYPGGALPHPQVRLLECDAEALARYLREVVGVRWVAVSYGDQAGFTDARYAPPLQPWIQTSVDHARAFQARVVELARTRRVVFDDGVALVLDLDGAR